MKARTLWAAMLLIFAVGIPLIAVPDYLFPDQDKATYAFSTVIGVAIILGGMFPLILANRNMQRKGRAVFPLSQKFPSTFRSTSVFHL